MLIHYANMSMQYAAILKANSVGLKPTKRLVDPHWCIPLARNVAMQILQMIWAD